MLNQTRIGVGSITFPRKGVMRVQCMLALCRQADSNQNGGGGSGERGYRNIHKNEVHERSICQNPEICIHFLLTIIIWNISASHFLPIVILIS